MNSADGLGQQTDSVNKNLQGIIQMWNFINDTLFPPTIVSYRLSFNPPLQVLISYYLGSVEIVLASK